MIIKRGNIYYADLGEPEGSVQGGVRPVVVIQNDVGNRFSSTVIVVAITSSHKKNLQPTQILLNTAYYPGLKRNSIILAEQPRTINKFRIQSYIGKLTDEDLARLNRALKKSIDIK